MVTNFLEKQCGFSLCVQRELTQYHKAIFFCLSFGHMFLLLYLIRHKELIYLFVFWYICYFPNTIN